MTNHEIPNSPNQLPEHLLADQGEVNRVAEKSDIVFDELMAQLPDTVVTLGLTFNSTDLQRIPELSSYTSLDVHHNKVLDSDGVACGSTAWIFTRSLLSIRGREEVSKIISINTRSGVDAGVYVSEHTLEYDKLQEELDSTTQLVEKIGEEGLRQQFFDREKQDINLQEEDEAAVAGDRDRLLKVEARAIETLLDLIAVVDTRE